MKLMMIVPFILLFCARVSAPPRLILLEQDRATAIAWAVSLGSQLEE